MYYTVARTLRPLTMFQICIRASGKAQGKTKMTGRYLVYDTRQRALYNGTYSLTRPDAKRRPTYIQETIQGVSEPVYFDVVLAGVRDGVVWSVAYNCTEIPNRLPRSESEVGFRYLLVILRIFLCVFQLTRT